MDRTKICLDFLKNVTQNLGKEEGCDLTGMVTRPLTEECDPGRLTAAAFRSSIAVVLVLFKLERREGLGICQH